MEKEIIYLALTIAIEAVVAILCMPWGMAFRILYAVVAVNLISHPLAWYWYGRGGPWLLVEICVTIFELLVFVLLFPRFDRRAMLTAVAMNVVSAGCGLLLARLV
ncbi:MAG: hypothetical protein Q7R83_02330 [bacterium]|nr:hypothetical protein [bacterium]